jgi:hypothetical protein
VAHFRTLERTSRHFHLRPSHLKRWRRQDLRKELNLHRDSQVGAWHITCPAMWHVAEASFEIALPTLTMLARGASNAKWRSGCLAPDRYVESICDWLIRGPLFLRGPKKQVIGQTNLNLSVRRRRFRNQRGEF